MNTNSLLILGSNSAIPNIHRFTTSQIININGINNLIDCGEGAQIRMQSKGVKINSIDNIYISHLHGDHFFGLAGLISTMNMQSRHQPLHIYCPDKLKEIIEMQLEASLTELQFECSYTLTDPNESRLITKAQDFEVYSVPLSHRIPTTGFFFKSTMRNKPFRYAYISDTIYKPDIIPVIKDATIIYHEATFTEEFRKQAIEKFHSTAKDAANIAKMTNAERLLIGHFSKRFNDTSVLVNEAKEVFENTIAIEDEMEIAL